MSSTPSPERRELLARLLREKGIEGQLGRTIPRHGGTGPSPLSFAQEAVWFLDQLEPDQALHNVPGAVRLTGQLDTSALERTLGEIVRRHGSLRTTIVETDGKPAQLVSPPGDFEMPVKDLSGGPREEVEAEVLRLATEEAHRVFDLERGPLFRAFLLRLGAAEHVLILNFHHIVIDGWSMGVFTQELAQLYRAFLEGRPSPLPELPIQITDFAAWQREELQGPALEEHLSYWKQQLAGDLVSLALPADHPRPAVQSFRGKHQAVRLSGELSDDLRSLSQRQGVTPFMTLMAGFLVVLYQSCGQTDAIIGSAVAHRNRRELEGLIGFLVNMLVLRTDLSGNPAFSELQRRVREVTLGAWSHQDLPLTHILKEVAPERDLSRNPLFQIQFSLLTPDENPAVYGYGLASGMIETLELPGIVMTPINVQYENARYDIAIFLWDMPQGIQGTIEYSTDLFDDSTIARLVARYESLLRFVVETPDAPLDELVERLEQREQATRAAAGETFAKSAKSKLKSIQRRRAGTSNPGQPETP